MVSEDLETRTKKLDKLIEQVQEEYRVEFVKVNSIYLVKDIYFDKVKLIDAKFEEDQKKAKEEFEKVEQNIVEHDELIEKRIYEAERRCNTYAQRIAAQEANKRARTRGGAGAARSGTRNLGVSDAGMQSQASQKSFAHVKSIDQSK